MNRLFCEIYIDTEENIEALEQVVKQASEKAFIDMNIGIVVSKNDDFDVSAKQRYPYSSIEASQYFVEIEAQPGFSQDSRQYQVGITRLIKALREAGRFVSASCDFEEFIATETGWNWTRDQPEPPGRNIKA